MVTIQYLRNAELLRGEGGAVGILNTGDHSSAGVFLHYVSRVHTDRLVFLPKSAQIHAHIFTLRRWLYQVSGSRFSNPSQRNPEMSFFFLEI